jgi:arylsulfatase|tara:strand:+ start:3950 stop:5359 length:1410 start_codon:yes stop_codon:yes gene_type:complete
MNYFKFTFVLILFFSCNSSLKKSPNLINEKPNIIIIYTDDQGYGDLSSFGSMYIKTPNIDALGAGGAILTDFLNASSTCSPSRAALLTGAYPIRTGVNTVLWPEGHGGFGGSKSKGVGLHPDEVTIAEVLKDNGYTTAMTGKWHLGDNPLFLPTKQGFDTYFGIPYSNDMNKEELPLLLNSEVVEIKPDQSLLTKRYTDFAIDFINDQKKGKPFFLYLAHTMPHIPIFASDKFRGKSKGSLYGDVIQEIDYNVGRLVKTLKDRKEFDNTIIIYTSDNGPWLTFGNHGGSSGVLRGGKFDVFEGGYRVPCVISWPNKIEPNTKIDQLISTIDIMPTLCAVSGAKLPENKIDGINVIDLLQNKPMPEIKERFFFYHKKDTLYGIRKGNWKYLKPSTFNSVELPGEDGKNGKGKWEVNHDESLYDLSTDLRELDNRLLDYPEIAYKLKERLSEFQSKLDKEKRPLGTKENIN